MKGLDPETGKNKEEWLMGELIRLLAENDRLQAENDSLRSVATEMEVK